MRELIGGIAAIVIGGFYLFTASAIRASALDDAVGPAGFPRLLAYAMIGFGIVLSIQGPLAMRAGRAGSAVPAGGPPETTDDDFDPETHGPTFGGLLRAAGMLGLGIGYLLIVRQFGYIPSITALIIAVALYQGAGLSWRVFAIGIIGAIAYYIIFVLVLGIPLPGGMFAELF